jgi:hypothetical protein
MELYHLYSSREIVWLIESRRIRCTGREGGNMRNMSKIIVAGRTYFENLVVLLEDNIVPLLCSDREKEYVLLGNGQ